MTAATDLRRTPLADWHAANGGRMVDFAGWSMPVQYGSIVEEHNAVRNAVGLFDVSHMGRLTVRGPRAVEFLDRVLTRRASSLRPGRIRYALVCNEAGGVLDDVLVGRGANDDDGIDYGLVVNASNRLKLLDWFGTNTIAGAELTDHTAETAMIAVQGPAAVALLEGLTDADLGSMKYYTSRVTFDVAGVNCSASRTGYTGEDGYELFCDAADAVRLWEALVAAGGAPCGLAARDTLRLEAGMPLYGHELDEQTNPLQADLAFAVNFDDAQGAPRSFIGRDAMLASRDDASLPVRVGLLVDGKRPPREGYPVLAGNEPIGRVTSGTHSPTLGKLIAMASLPREHAAVGTELAVDVRGKGTPATVTPLPFYKRS